MVAIVALSAAAQACSPNAICRLPGPINDPSNRTLRRSIMSFGLGQFCRQMTERDAPLMLSPDAPVIGRFFPQQCSQQVLDNGDLWVQFGGFGYAWTSLSKKITFTSAATIQYNQDFKCADDDGIYAYFDPRVVSPPDFRILQLEQPVANLVQNWIAPFVDNFGRQIVSGQLAQGFTVIEHPGGNTEFGMGHLSLGRHPAHPFDLHGSSRVTYENLRTEVHGGERDFIGPMTIDGSRRAIFLHMRLEGAPSVNILVTSKADGDALLQLYVQYGGAGSLPPAPRFAEVIRYGQEYERAVPVAAGMYYVVIDNTPSAGQVAPSPSPLFNLLGDSAAVVNYAIQIGDAP